MKEKKYETLKKDDNALEIKELENVAGGTGWRELIVEYCPYGCGFHVTYEDPDAKYLVDEAMKDHIERCH